MYSPPLALGAGHGSEIPYIFKTWMRTVLAKRLTDEDRAMSNTISACWVAFAKSGRPPCPGTPSWPAYSPACDELMEFGTVIGVRPALRRAAQDLIVDRFLATVGGR